MRDRGRRDQGRLFANSQVPSEPQSGGQISFRENSNRGQTGWYTSSSILPTFAYGLTVRAGLKLYGLTVRFWTKSYGQTVRFRAAAYGQTVRSPSSASAVGAKILRCFNPGYRRAAAKKRTPAGGLRFCARASTVADTWRPAAPLRG